MTLQPNTDESAEYRLILMLPESRKVLVSGTCNSGSLPSVRIPQRTRIARELQTAIHNRWKLDVIVLHLPRPENGGLPCAIAEVRLPKQPPCLRAVEITQLTAFGLSEKLRAQLVSVLSQEPSDSPFSRIGWIDQAIAWLEAETGTRFSSKCHIEQYNAGGGFSLVRFRMEDESEYWLKATGEPNTHEFAITCLLSELAGDYLPTVISTRPAWNAWLMCGAASQEKTLYAECFPMLGDAVESMAALQLNTVNHRSDMLAVGAFDQSMTIFQRQSEELFDFLEEVMQLQTSTKAPRLEAARIREIRVIFEDTSRRMEDLNLPQAIIHGDMNRGNILEGAAHCKFLDWSEAYVGCPFVTLQHLLLLNQAENPGILAVRNSLLQGRYKKVWLQICEDAAIDVGFIYMPLLAIGSALFGRCNWLTTSAREDTRRHTYARNLARHMDRAARAPELLAALRCPSMLAVRQVAALT